MGSCEIEPHAAFGHGRAVLGRDARPCWAQCCMGNRQDLDLARWCWRQWKTIASQRRKRSRGTLPSESLGLGPMLRKCERWFLCWHGLRGSSRASWLGRRMGIGQGWCLVSKQRPRQCRVAWFEQSVGSVRSGAIKVGQYQHPTATFARNIMTHLPPLLNGLHLLGESLSLCV